MSSTTRPTPPPSVATPALTGLTEKEAADVVAAVQAKVPPRGYSSFSARHACNGNVDPAKFGRVFAQSPAAGTPLTDGQPVTVSVHQACAAVPDVGKLPVTEARAVLAKANLALGQTATGTCVRGLAGLVVVSQEHAPGTVLPTGTPVGVTVTPPNCG